MGEEAALPAGAIRAEVSTEQTLKSGSRIEMRLKEDITAAGMLLPAGTLIYGTAAFDGQRMGIVVTSLEHEGNILPVELSAYDLDGQPGLFIPNTSERNAAKEAAAGVAGGFGSSISFSRSAGQQVAMDVVRGAMSGGTQYLAAKLREVKVTVKAGHRLFLISKQ